jgi:hypothetical protein
MVLGLNVTEAPVGTPVALRLTALLKLPPMAVVTVDEPLLPCVTVIEVGVAEADRVGGPVVVTVRGISAVCVSPPPSPLTTIG